MPKTGKRNGADPEKTVPLPLPPSLHPTDTFQPVQKPHGPRRWRDRVAGSRSSFSYSLAPGCHPRSVLLPGTLRRGATPDTALAAGAWRSRSARPLWDREGFSGSWRSCSRRETRSIQPRLHQSPAHQGPRPLYALQASGSPVSAIPLPQATPLCPLGALGGGGHPWFRPQLTL